MTAPSAETGNRYGRTLLAWAVAVALPPLVVVVLLIRAISARCGPDSVDCSWGFEFLIAIPVLLACMLTLGPLAVYLALWFGDDPLAGRTVLWAYVLVVPSAALALVTAGIVVFVLPPLGGRYLALRPTRAATISAGGPPSPPASQPGLPPALS